MPPLNKTRVLISICAAVIAVSIAVTTASLAVIVVNRPKPSGYTGTDAVRDMRRQAKATEQLAPILDEMTEVARRGGPGSTERLAELQRKMADKQEEINRTN